MNRLRIGLMVLVLLFSSLAHRPAWAASTLIRLVAYDQTSQRIVIFADGPLQPRSFTLENPHRWVLDFPNTRYHGATVRLPAIPNSPIKGIRVSQWNMGTVRMVFDLSKKQTYPYQLLQTSANNYRLAFHLNGASAAASAAKPVTKPAAKPSSKPTPSRAVEKPEKSAPPRAAEAPEKPATPAPARTAEKPTKPTKPAPARTREKPPKPSQASPAPKPEKPPSYAPAPIEDGESGLTLKRVGEGWQLTFTGNGKIQYRLVGPTRHDRLVFEISGGSVDLPHDSLYVDNGLIARVRSTPQAGGMLRVIVELDQEVGFAVRTTPSERSVVVAMARPGIPIPAGPPMAAAIPAPQPSIVPQPPLPRAVDAAMEPKKDDRKRITLDPGHGGEDPGGRSANGDQEKDITLALALKLQKLMQESGMEVQMTRTDDMAIQLRPRVAIGDAFDSDIFISIHTNAIANPKINGIETYYFTPQSLPLARAVHRQLVAKLGRPDRGVRRNNFVVVKYNKMPACLVEIGYLTNPTEEKLLKSPAYQQKAAEAILAGVQDYFRSKSYRQ